MEKIISNIQLNHIFERESTSIKIKNILNDFDEKCNDLTYKKGIYIYGSPGSGKTSFVINLLKEMNYDVIKYDAGDVRNTGLINTITSNNISNRNVLDMMTKKVKKIVIVMDEIDGMNNGDKGGITALIKLIRQKKTKKQKLENTTMNPIICIGNYCIDKKIRELTKVCNTFEIKLPTIKQMKQILLTMFPDLNTKDNLEKQNTILNYIQCDVRKLNFVYDVYKTNPKLFDNNALSLIFQQKSNNEDSKRITQTLLNNYIPLNNHSQFMNETERTIVALLWHENVVDMIEKYDKQKSIPIYQKILEKMSYADYIDRITFQNQIWQFNEMSSLMKTFHNNKIYHDNFPENKNKFQPSEVRFTKVLTKYSTEYNNMMFIYGLCQELDLDKSDLIAIFQEIRLLKPFNMLTNIETMNEIEEIFESYNINKLDIQRIYRYMDKSVKKDMVNLDLEDTE
jgi:DNA polymerase III delta prime subunit